VTLPDDGRWLSYSELAGERGISRQSAVRLVRRQRWRRQMANDGEARVFVPADHLPGVTPPDDGTGHSPGRAPGDDTGHQNLMAGALAALEGAVAALQEQLGQANTRADRAEARADDLRAQIDVLNAEMVATGAEADRAMADERMRADRLNERVDALSADLTRAEADRRVAEVRADKAETAIAAEHARADALRTAIDELKAGQALMADIHARDLAVAQHDAQAGQQAAAVLRQAEAARKARGPLRRAWDGWPGR
jgi:hypothetical protein